MWRRGRRFRRSTDPRSSDITLRICIIYFCIHFRMLLCCCLLAAALPKAPLFSGRSVDRRRRPETDCAHYITTTIDSFIK